MLQKGLSGMTMGALQKFYPDVISLMVVYFGADGTAALAIMYRLGAIIQCVPIGFMGATAILAGKKVGEE